VLPTQFYPISIGSANLLLLTKSSFYATRGLTRIRAAVEEGAVNVFKERKSRRPELNLEQYEQLKAEKERLEATVIEEAAELALLKKKITWARW